MTHQEAGQTVCYAFTRAASSTPPLPGRGEVVLTVTERPGGARDAVAISAGFAYAPNSEAAMQVEGDHAVVLHQPALRLRPGRPGRGVRVRARAPGDRQVRRARAAPAVVDTFSLRGFAPAYAAIKACSAHG